MCNPRRIQVTATALLNEAWQRETTRSVELFGSVTGQARVVQPLDITLGGPTLLALETALADEESGWTEIDAGYRYNVEGGYVTYLTDERALEIVATVDDTVYATGQFSTILQGRLHEEISAQGKGTYYEDGWGGRTEEVGQREAEARAQEKLKEAARSRIEQAKNEAEKEASEQVEVQARRQAESSLQQQTAQRQKELAQEAQQHLETVGLRCRQAFNRVLAQAYREAILAYARRSGASEVQCHENGDVVDIAFNVSG